MNKILNTWIAESESWQSFIDFKIPKEARARYPFLSKYDDFYLSLMSSCFEELKKENPDLSKMLSIAHGLEIFSLENKRNNFEGIDYSNNALYSAAMYYLAGYSSSACIISSLFNNDDFNSTADKFIFSFLKRENNKSNEFSITLNDFLRNGDFFIVKNLINKLQAKLEESLNNNSIDFTAFLLCISILKKFIDDNIWFDLLNLHNNVDYWKPYVIKCLNKSSPIWSFFPSQRLALEKGVLSDKTISLQMPTSSGKTYLSEIIIYNEIRQNNKNKVLYLAPFRALAAELKKTLGSELRSLGISSKTIYGGNLPTTEERDNLFNCNVLISTPEKFMAIENIFPNIHNEFSTIICDEGHLLDDYSRGLEYELLLTRIKINSETPKRFIFVSAIIPNLAEINHWLGGDENTIVESDYRPTQLEFAFLYRMDQSRDRFYLNVNPTKKRPFNYQLYRFLDSNEVNIVNPNTGQKRLLASKKAISSAVALKSINIGSVFLFAPHKRGYTGVEGLASELLSQLEWTNNKSLINSYNHKTIDDLVGYFSKVFGDTYLLTKTASVGFLFHHGDFPQFIREIIEDQIRANQIKLVICTNTLAEGINLPIKTIVIHSTERFNSDVPGNYEVLKIRDLKNLVGRAGRAGKETKGLIIIPHESDFRTIEKLINEVDIEPVKGDLYNLIKPFTHELITKGLVVTQELLDKYSNYFEDILDKSLIEMLAEDINEEDLMETVEKFVSNTFSYYQSSSDERDTLKKIFSIKAETVLPFIKNDEFQDLKNSGASISSYKELSEIFDFENEIWENLTDALAEDWLSFILDNGIFLMETFQSIITEFNSINSCDIDNQKIKTVIIMWMNGEWFENISKIGIEMHHLLRLINNFLSFKMNTLVSSAIRLAEIRNSEKEISPIIISWPSLLQFGFNNISKLNLMELGLTDREAVLQLDGYLKNLNYVHLNISDLKKYLLKNKEIILGIPKDDIPSIAKKSIDNFIRKLG